MQCRIALNLKHKHTKVVDEVNIVRQNNPNSLEFYISKNLVSNQYNILSDSTIQSSFSSLRIYLLYNNY